MERAKADSKEATFLVSIPYRQNQSWQGTVEWLDGKKKLPFRSELELIQLIDQVISAQTPQGFADEKKK